MKISPKSTRDWLKRIKHTSMKLVHKLVKMETQWMEVGWDFFSSYLFRFMNILRLTKKQQNLFILFENSVETDQGKMFHNFNQWFQFFLFTFSNVTFGFVMITHEYFTDISLLKFIVTSTVGSWERIEL